VVAEPAWLGHSLYMTQNVRGYTNGQV
jgi:hypothetical protein